MPTETIIELSAVASNPSAEFSKRIAAVDALGASGSPSAIPLLQSLLGRSVADVPTKNWDPVAAQRVVALHAIAALHRLGNDSELSRVASLVADAGQVLQGPYDERRSATATIAIMGSVSVVRDLVAVLQNGSSTATANVIEVLDTLHLPQAPARQDLGNIHGAKATVTGVTQSLDDLLKLVISAAHGSVRLSPGVERMVASGASPIGRSEHDEAEVAWMLQRFFPSIELDYYIEGKNVVICTFAESAERWRDWWSRHGGRLSYSPERQAFVLTAP